MIKISKQLRKYFISVSLLSILFITITSNVSISFFFSDYIKESRSKDDIKVVEYIEQLYSNYGKLNSYTLMSLMHYVFSEDVIIRIRDMDNDLMFDSNTSHMINMNKINDDDIAYSGYPLMYIEEQFGIVEVGRPKSIISNLEDKRFLVTINGIFIVASIFTLGIAFYFSSHLGKKILKPIYNIRENTNFIEDGKYKNLLKVNTNILELYELSLSIDDLAQRLDYQEILRRRLTNDIAHELRTPLASIKSHLEAFMDGVWEPSIEKLSIVYNDTNRLNKLIDELSDLSFLENDKINIRLENVDLSHILNNILESFEPMFISKRIGLEKKIQKDVEVLGDIDSLNRIFINVLSNAFKYSNDYGTIFVSLEKLNDIVKVSIKDTGIGIPGEDLKFVFERFYRSDISRDRETGGTGIGLTITKALVEFQGGNIKIESEVGKGTEVIIKFIK